MADRNVKIIKASGHKPVVWSMPKVASTAFDKNSLVELGSTINPSDDNDTIVFGVILEEVASTDTDYASTTEKLVEVIYPGDLVEMATNGTLTVGTSYGISNAYTVDSSDTSNDVFTCIKSLSSTRAQGIMKNLVGEAVQ
jgi:hypothetical protein